MVDTIDKLLQINDEAFDESRGLQAGEEGVDADGRFNGMIVRALASPTPADDSHNPGTTWINTATQQSYVSLANPPAAAVWFETTAAASPARFPKWNIIAGELYVLETYEHQVTLRVMRNAGIVRLDTGARLAVIRGS